MEWSGRISSLVEMQSGGLTRSAQVLWFLAPSPLDRGLFVLGALWALLRGWELRGLGGGSASFAGVHGELECALVSCGVLCLHCSPSFALRGFLEIDDLLVGAGQFCSELFDFGLGGL